MEITSSKIKDYAKSLGIDMVGITSAELFNNAQNSNYTSAIVGLFPYYTGEKNGNLSKYTYGKDYHIAAREYLEKIVVHFGFENYEIHADIGPSIDRELAVNAGLCFKGKNTMAINGKYGSYFFIGYIVCREALDFDVPCTDKCMGCNKCINACPGGAINDDFTIDIEKCASNISQKKGELSRDEIALIKKTGLCFGCDICQDICPHNESAEITPIKEFKENTLSSLSISDIENLSNKEFKEKYGDRAFSWRGKQVLLRNLKILD